MASPSRTVASRLPGLPGAGGAAAVGAGGRAAVELTAVQEVQCCADHAYFSECI